jgi:hypothetical protein
MTLSRVGVLVIALALAPLARANADKSPDTLEIGEAPIKPIVEQHPVTSPRQFPRVELFVGYSYANLNLGSQSSLFVPAGRSFSGMQFDAKFNQRKYLAWLFDVSGQWSHSRIPDPLGYETHMQLDSTQLLAGPEFTLRTHKFNIFGHTLFGFTRMSLSELDGYTDCSYGLPASPATGCPNNINLIHRTNLAFGAGGGIERNWKNHFAFRLLQADYIPTRLDKKWQSQLRLGIGMIVKF